MTLDYKKMFLIVTEEAVVKGHFTFIIRMFLPPVGADFLLNNMLINLKQLTERIAPKPPSSEGALVRN